MNKRTWVLLAAAALALFVYAVFLRRGDEDRIRQELTELSEAVRLGPSESERPVRAVRIQKVFARIFSPKVRAQLPDYGDPGGGREGLAALAISAGESFGALELRFDRVRIQISPKAQSASVDTVATVTTTELGGETKKTTRHLDLRFENLDGAWRIAYVAALDDPG